MRTDPARLRARCLFCDPAAHGQSDQVLLTSENLFVFAGLGAIAEGYLIIAPHRCAGSGGQASSIAELPPELLDELVYLRAMVLRFYRETYGCGGVSFEHGRAGSCSRLGTDTLHCYHPHLCCYPMARSGSLRLRDRVNLPNRHALTGLHALPETAGAMPYLYIEDHDSDTAPGGAGSAGSAAAAAAVAFVVPRDDQLESQFLRRKLAEHVGAPPLWDWASHPTPERVRSVCDAFSRWLERQRADLVVDFDAQSPARLHFARSVLRQNRHAYDQLARQYSQRWQGRVQRAALGRFLAHLPSQASGSTECLRLLDLGCGTGTYTRVFAELGFECHAMDPSPRVLEAAAAWLDGSCGRPRVNFIEGDDSRLDEIAPHSLDAAWFSAALLHVPRTRSAALLAALARTLTAGGILYLSTRQHHAADGATVAAMEVRREGRVFFYYDDAELERLLLGAGFDVLTSWQDITCEGTSGDRGMKHWRHLIVRRREVA